MECELIEDALREAGFGSIHRSTLVVPIGAKKGQAGRAGQLCSSKAWAEISRQISQTTIASPKKIEHAWNDYQKYLEEEGSTLTVTIWRAQRPAIQSVGMEHSPSQNAALDAMRSPMLSDDLLHTKDGLRDLVAMDSHGSRAASESDVQMISTELKPSQQTSKLHRRMTLARVVSRLVSATKRQNEKQQRAMSLSKDELCE
jgi:hypothetical protein